MGDNIPQPQVMSIRDALRLADEMELDLIEISPKAEPPVCRIADYQKFLYQQKKKAKELWEKANAISPWTSDDKLTFAYNADGGHEVIYTAVVNSINNVLGAGVAATNPYPTFNDFRTAVSDRKVNGAFRSGWQPDYPSAENYLVQNFASAAADGNGSNDGVYKNP